MIDEEKQNKLYDAVIEGYDLTSKKLKEYGFCSEDLENFIKEGILEREENGYYSFLAINDLFHYSKKLRDEKQYDKLTLCLQKWYELDPNPYNTSFHLFLVSVKEKNSEKAMQNFDEFYRLDHDHYHRIKYDYCSYLLNMDPSLEGYRKDMNSPLVAKFVNGKLNELYKKGIVLLKPMDLHRRNQIHEIVKGMDKIASFDIGKEENAQAVLRIKPDQRKEFDLTTLLKKGSESYNNGDYDACIKNYKYALSIHNPKSFIYARLGLCYLRKNNKDVSISYLKVANELGKKEQSEFDYTDLILSLEGEIPHENYKPSFKMEESDFENDINDYYGIKEMKQILEMISSGMSLHEVYTHIDLDPEKEDIVTLILARECYIEENYALGDKYMKIVEKKKNKSKFIRSLFIEIQKNKKFYKNRNVEGHKKLIFTSKNRKKI